MDIPLATSQADQQEAKVAQNIIARLERLPLSSWQVKIRIIVGAATFFDAFDALAIAYVLPVLAPLWHLNPRSIGVLISAGFVGQLIGALSGGYFAERFGRRPVIVASVIWFGIFSLACVWAWSYPSLAVLRMLQGLGLGAEVPVAAAYISELAKSRGRGRFVLLFELIFPVGLLMAGVLGAWIVPRFGWRDMFLVGAVPALFAIFMVRLIPESPRWMVARGRNAAAEATTSFIEAKVRQATGYALPPILPSLAAVARRPPTYADLFGPFYRRRTFVVWICWFATYLVNFGLVTWLPSIYRNAFHLPLGLALRYALFTSAIGLLGSFACAMLVDRVGRRIWFSGSFLVAALGLLLLWFVGPSTAERVLVLATLSYAGIGSLSLGLYLYTAELYPTRARALGVGAATAWLRIASIIGPFVVGSMIASTGLGGVFLLFGLAAAIAAIVTAMFATETNGRVLEEISP